METGQQKQKAVRILVQALYLIRCILINEGWRIKCLDKTITEKTDLKGLFVSKNSNSSSTRTWN